jgi:hypothetical protein
MRPHPETDPCPESDGWTATLPGPDRKRSAARYEYRVTYRNPDEEGAGCVLLWEVAGGRLGYQIALERDDAGTLRLHCSCADAIYRAEAEGRFCKHVRGLLEIGRRRADPTSSRASGAA